MVNRDGQEIAPLGWQGNEVDFEVTGKYEWSAYYEDLLIGTGGAKTRLGLYISLLLAKRRLTKEYNV